MPVKTYAAACLVGIGGLLCTACRNDTPSARATAAPPEDSASLIERKVLPPIIAADERDDPLAAGKLPRSGTVGGWTKTRPAIVVDPADACSQILDARGTLCEAYRLRFAASAGYTNRDDPQRSETTLTMVDTETVEDAIGLFLACSPVATPGDLKSTGGAVHVQDVDGRSVWSAWRGRRVVTLVGTAPSESLERLGGRLLLATPGATLPGTLPLGVLDGHLPGQLWVVRSVRHLIAAGMPGLEGTDAVRLDRMLGLTGETWMLAAGFAVADTDEINHLFAVRYATLDDASAAYARCMQATARGEISAMLIEPVEEVLAGSWTPGVESISHQLLSVRQRLRGDSLASAAR